MNNNDDACMAYFNMQHDRPDGMTVKITFFASNAASL